MERVHGLVSLKITAFKLTEKYQIQNLKGATDKRTETFAFRA